MLVGRVNIGSWLLRVLAWDGLLPACLALAPIAIKIVVPDRRDVLEIAAVGLPIIAFLIRVAVGTRHIMLNNCNYMVKYCQCCVFFLAIVPLVLIDAIMILSHLMPKGEMFATRADCAIWAILLSIYLALMAIAMYPGRLTAEP